MPFLGTAVNTIAVIVGSIIGLLLKRGVSAKVQSALMQALGLCTIFIGASGTIQNMFSVDKSLKINSNGTMILIASMVIGTIIGEKIDIERRLNGFGDWIRKKTLAVSKEDTNSRFTEGFVSATLVICIGAMAIVGAIYDGMGQPETLFAKSILDFVIVLIFSSTMGVGVAFSAIPMFVYQLVFALIGFAAGNVMGENLITNLSIVGDVLIFGVGVNLAFGKSLGSHKIKVGNMLPALVIPVIYEGIIALI